MTIENQLGIVRDGFPKAISNNVAQIAQMGAGWAETTWPYLGIFNLPYLVNSVDEVSKLQKAIRPISVREYAAKGIMWLSDYAWVSQELFCKKEIADVTKLSGLTIRGWTTLMLDWLKVAGAVPSNIPSIEVYTAIQRGVIDGAITGIATANSGSWTEVAPNAYQIHFIFVAADLVVNKAAFDALPKEYQDILLDEGKIFRQNFDKDVVTENATAWDAWKAKGGKSNEVPAAQFAVLKSQSLPLWDKWTASSGATGQEALAAAKTALGIK
jgi:TRAP-type C4-dicarboxylate transport system substrate-binding protein